MSISISPYFEIQEGRVEEFKNSWATIAPEIEANEPGCVFYQFTFNGNVAFCREGYNNVENVLAHLERVDATLKKVLEFSKIVRFEVHGPAADVSMRSCLHYRSKFIKIINNVTIFAVGGA